MHTKRVWNKIEETIQKPIKSFESPMLVCRYCPSLCMKEGDGEISVFVPAFGFNLYNLDKFERLKTVIQIIFVVQPSQRK